MSFKLLSIISLILSLAVGTLASTSWVLHERLASVPAGYSLVGSASTNQILDLKINLANGDLSGLTDALDEASTPGTDNFRQWLTADQVHSIVIHLNIANEVNPGK